MYRLTWRLPLAGLVTFSHLQFSQIRGRQPYSIVRKIPYLILQLGLLVNGADTDVVGLDNKTSMIGQSLPLGHANAGDALTFVLNNTDGDIIKKAYSDPTMNVSYDIDGSRGHQHVYSTSYTATSPNLDSIPVGTFVSWADQAFPNGDFSYNNLDVVLTNVSVSVPGSIAGAGLPGLIVACGVLLALARRRRQKIA